MKLQRAQRNANEEQEEKMFWLLFESSMHWHVRLSTRYADTKVIYFLLKEKQYCYVTHACEYFSVFFFFQLTVLQVSLKKIDILHITIDRHKMLICTNFNSLLQSNQILKLPFLLGLKILTVVALLVHELEVQSVLAQVREAPVFTDLLFSLHIPC